MQIGIRMPTFQFQLERRNEENPPQRSKKRNMGEHDPLTGVTEVKTQEGTQPHIQEDYLKAGNEIVMAIKYKQAQTGVVCVADPPYPHGGVRTISKPTGGNDYSMKLTGWNAWWTRVTRIGKE